MGVFSKLAGIVNNFFQVGGPSGPALKNNTGVIEARNAADNAFAIVRGATPIADADLTTKAYVDTIFKPIPCSLQFDGNNALPANSGTEKYYVVTTTGPNASIGQVLWDDGSSAGNVTVLAAKTGNEIVTTATFSGGAIVLPSNQNFVWSGAAWTNVSPSVSGALYVVDVALGTAASQSSVSAIPANAIILSAQLSITTPYTAGTTISLGQTGSTSLLQATSDNFPTVAGVYTAPQRTAWGVTALPLLITVGGAPSAGAGFATISYALALN